MCASTLCPFSSSTRNMALGSGSETVPSTSMASFLGKLPVDLSHGHARHVRSRAEPTPRARGQAAGGPKPRKPRRQALVYGPELTAPLAKVWATLDGPCGKRLAPFMEEIVGVLQRFGELELGPRERELLLCMSAA